MNTKNATQLLKSFIPPAFAYVVLSTFLEILESLQMWSNLSEESNLSTLVIWSLLHDLAFVGIVIFLVMAINVALAFASPRIASGISSAIFLLFLALELFLG